MIRKKICMLGAAGVGKTSLTRRYVDSIFSDDYLSTIGVKIDHKDLEIDGVPLGLVLWDVQGQDNARSVRPSFLKGASGYCLVIDLTRSATVETAVEIRDSVRVFVGDLPYVVVLNKTDLINDRELSWECPELEKSACGVVWASAKLDSGIEESFSRLGSRLLES